MTWWVSDFWLRAEKRDREREEETKKMSAKDFYSSLHTLISPKRAIVLRMTNRRAWVVTNRHNKSFNNEYRATRPGLSIRARIEHQGHDARHDGSEMKAEAEKIINQLRNATGKRSSRDHRIILFVVNGYVIFNKRDLTLFVYIIPSLLIIE